MKINFKFLIPLAALLFVAVTITADTPGIEKYTTCPTDINRDGVVNNADLSLLLLKFNQSCNCREDINRDGVVNTQDLSLLLLDFNKTCHCNASLNIEPGGE
jgi:hypothetical protein